MEEGRAKQLPLDVKRIIAQPANIEKPAPEKETAQISAAIVSKNSAITNEPVKYEASVTKVKEQSDNITGYSANKSTDKISTLNTVIAYPLYKENEPPVYPEIARVRGYEGVVLVFAEVLPNGRVGEIKIRKSSGYAILDQSALQAVKPWKFEPAKKSGNPFTAWVELPIKFILHNSQS
jgi:protein TonB